MCSEDTVELVGPVQMNSPVDLETDMLGILRMISFSRMNGTETRWDWVEGETQEQEFNTLCMKTRCVRLFVEWRCETEDAWRRMWVIMASAQFCSYFLRIIFTEQLNWHKTQERFPCLTYLTKTPAYLGLCYHASLI